MAWVRFDDGFFRHPKVVTAGRDARDLYMAGVFYANSNLTDGFIPEGALRLIAADAGINSHIKSVKALLEVRLWVDGDGGYQIHDYLEYQASAASVTASREANAKRQEDYRNRKRNAGNNAQSNAVTNGPVTDPPINIPNPIAPSEQRESKDSLMRASSVQQRFDAFWAAYPKKVDKERARKAFSRIRWSEVEFADLMAALSQQAQSAQWTKDSGEFIPHPATWINNARWNVELPVSTGLIPIDPDAIDLSPGRNLSNAELIALTRKGISDESRASNRSSGDTPLRMAETGDHPRNDPSIQLGAGRRTG